MMTQGYLLRPARLPAHTFSIRKTDKDIYKAAIDYGTEISVAVARDRWGILLDLNRGALQGGWYMIDVPVMTVNIAGKGKNFYFSW